MESGEPEQLGEQQPVGAQVQTDNTPNIMAQSVAIRPMPEFNPDADVGASVATRWNNWISDFDMFILASGITDPKRQRALLLYQAGPRVREIFKQLPETGDSSDYDTAKAKLKTYFEPQKNRRYEIYCFRKAVQEQRETLDHFHTRLRTLAQTCEFADQEFEIEEQIIIGGSSSKIRRRALRDPTFSLAAMLLEGRRDEQSTFQARDIETTEHTPLSSAQTEQDQIDAVYQQPKCRNCGGSFPHKGALVLRKESSVETVANSIISRAFVEAEQSCKLAQTRLHSRPTTANGIRYGPSSIIPRVNPRRIISTECIIASRAQAQTSPCVGIPSTPSLILVLLST